MYRIVDIQGNTVAITTRKSDAVDMIRFDKDLKIVVDKLAD